MLFRSLPELGSSLGRGIREFRNTVTGEKADDDDEPEVKAIRATAPPAAPVEQPTEPEVVHDKQS